MTVALLLFLNICTSLDDGGLTGYTGISQDGILPGGVCLIDVVWQ